MHLLELLVQLIVGISWPTAIILVAYLLKGDLKALLKRISHIKYKDIEAKFEKDLLKVEEKVSALPSRTNRIYQGPHEKQLDLIYRIAKTSPRAAIIESWRLVEQAIKQAEQTDQPTKHLNTTQPIRWLQENSKLDKENIELVMQLRQMRNAAVHSSEFETTQTGAERYAQVAAVAADIIVAATGTKQ